MNFPLIEETCEDSCQKFDDTLANMVISLMMSNNGNEAETQNNAVGGVTTDNPPEETEGPENTQDDNPNITRVSVLSPQQNDLLPDNPKIIGGSSGMKPMSTPSSRSSRRRLQLKAEIAADEARAEIEREQEELELRRKLRELEKGLKLQKSWRKVEMELEAEK